VAGVELLLVKDVLLLGNEGGLSGLCILLFKFIDIDDDLWQYFDGSGGAGSEMDS
jgi:hypothetical protein